MGNGIMDGVGSMFGGGMFFGPLLMIGVLLLIVYAIVRIAKGAGGAQQTAQNAKQILDTRLAAGEIDVAEYAELKRQITS